METQIRLYRNPWSKTLADGVVLQILQTATVNLAEKLQEMIDGNATNGSDSFGVVLLDPTADRRAVQAKDIVMASVVFGPTGGDLLPNALAKADAHDRHGIPNGVLVNHASFCLGDDDFAWGYSAEYSVLAPDADGDLIYGVAIAAGSGLSAVQDQEMALMFLTEVMDQVKERRDQWIAERRSNGRQGWYNEENQPGAQYAAIHELTPIATL